MSETKETAESPLHKKYQSSVIEVGLKTYLKTLQMIQNSADDVPQDIKLEMTT